MIVYSYQFSRGRVRLLLILRELPELDRALRPLDLLATLTMRDTPYLDSESNKEVCRLAAVHNNRRGIRHVRKRTTVPSSAILTNVFPSTRPGKRERIASCTMIGVEFGVIETNFNLVSWTDVDDIASRMSR